MTAISARKLVGYAAVGESVLAEKSIYQEIVRQDVLANADATTMKVYVNAGASIQAYVPGTGVALAQDGSAYVTISNLVENSLNEGLDGFTVESAPETLVMQRFDAGMKARGEWSDTTVLTGMIDNGTEAFAATKNKPVVATIYPRILNLKKKLDDVKADKDDRTLTVNPEMENLMLQVDSKIILNTVRGDDIISNGFIGKIAGFAVYSTSLLPAGTNMIASHINGYAAKEIYKVEPKLQNTDDSTHIGDSAIQDRVAFLHGAVRPTLIQVDNSAA